MLNVQICTAGFVRKISDLLFAVDHHGQLLCPLCFYSSLLCCLSDGMFLTEMGGGGGESGAPFIDCDHLIRLSWLPWLLWEGKVASFPRHIYALIFWIFFS